jgi:hypothetical protein
MSVSACVFRNSRNYASDEKMIGVDRRTGETMFSDDRAYYLSVAVQEDIGNVAGVAALASALRLSGESEALLQSFLINGSHSGDVIPCERIGAVAESASTLLSHSQLDSDVVIFLKKVLRLCRAAQSEDNPIVFV